MILNTFTADILMKICKLLGANATANLIDFYEDVPDAKMKKALERFVERLELKFKSRLFTFKDMEKSTVLRHFIVKLKPSESIMGEPMIIINDFQEGVKVDKNPVLNLELFYDSIEDRDDDIEELKFLLK